MAVLLAPTPDVLIDYLSHHATTLNPRTLTRRLTALKNWHLYQGFGDQTAYGAVRETLTGIKNVHGQPKKKAPALSLEALITLVGYLRSSNRLIDWRNNALLQIGFFGAFRRSELVAIRWEHIHFVPEGIEILIPRSKTDQGGDGQVCAFPYGDEKLCPVTAHKNWREKASSQSSPVFRRITKGGRVHEQAIVPDQVNAIVRSIAVACQLPDAHTYSSHSLRRGFATTASKKDPPFSSIIRQGRWRHEGTVLGYIEEGKRFETNAVGVILGEHFKVGVTENQ